MKANRGAISRDDRGVADVLGSVLLVAITVSMMVGLSFVVLSIDGPVDVAHADLRFDAAMGPDVTWGTGDEVIRLTHTGGEALPRESTRLVYTVGSTVTQFGPSDLDGAFDDGKLTIGESWTRTFTIQENDLVKATAIFANKAVLSLSTVRSPPQAIDCSADTTEPIVVAWLQTPSDVNSLTPAFTDVDISLTLADDCSGVNNAVLPTLQWKIDAGPWTDEPMTYDAVAGQFKGTIPGQDWPWLSFPPADLLYRVINYEDLNGNLGLTSVQSEEVSTVEPTQYVVGFTANEGQVTAFPQATWEDLIYASLKELDGFHLAESGTITSGGGVGNPGNVGQLDGAYATTTTTQWIETTDFDVATQTGAIGKVELLATGLQSALGNDQIDFQVSINGGSWQAVPSSFTPPTLGAGDYVADITAFDADWTWNDVATMDVRATHNKVGSPDTISLDYIAIQVTKAAAQSLDVEFDWDALLPGVQTLEIQYLTTGEAFEVDIWNDITGTWVPYGPVLTSTTVDTWTHVLTAGEGAGNDPRIRFRDTTSAGSPATLSIDYARIVSI